MSEAACGFHHDRTGCKIRHVGWLQQVGPKPLIQQQLLGSVLVEAKCRSALIRLVYGYVLAGSGIISCT